MKKKYKVIDTHAHFGLDSNKVIEKSITENGRRKRLLNDINELKQKVGFEDSVIDDDNSINAYVQIMKKNGIVQSWIHQLSFDEELGYEILDNKSIAMAIEKYPDLFKGFASVNPNSSDSLEQLEYAIDVLKLHAFKLNPNDYGGFWLNDKDKLYPLYDYCSQINIPISVHTGITPGTIFKMKHNYPILLDDVAVDFPNLKIIVEHMGYPWNDLCYYMVGRHKNMYITTTAVANILIHNNPRNFILELCKMISIFGSEKILWGSDWTATPNIEEVLNYMKNLSIPISMRKMMNLPKISDNDIKNILYSNALNVFSN